MCNDQLNESITIYQENMAKSIKTNALRLLDKAKIDYEIKEYQFDDNHLDGKHVLLQVEMEKTQIHIHIFQFYRITKPSSTTDK